jgi:RNA polymerase sigma-70 factor (TIGR02960 family)
MNEATLARAQADDGEAFRELIDPYRRELQAHCYRILGSVQDAEDVLQEALLAAWRSLGRFDGRSLQAWLYRIATNRCLNYLRGESRRPHAAGLPDRGAGWTGLVRSDEPWWLEPYPYDLGDLTPGPEARHDTRESIALSFVAGLQHLRPRQRAVLILRDVLGFPAAEVAGILDTTPAAVNSALIRARAGLRPDRDPHDVPLPRSPAEATIVERFVDAFERVDLDRLVALLTEDARLAMPPEPLEFRATVRVALGACAKTLTGKPAAGSTQRRKRSVFCNALGYAVELGRLAANPVDRIQWTAPAVAQTICLTGARTWRRSTPACTTPRCARRRR